MRRAAAIRVLPPCERFVPCRTPSGGRHPRAPRVRPSAGSDGRKTGGQRRHHAVLVCFAEVGAHRQAHHLGPRPDTLRAAISTAVRGVGGLVMQWSGVVHRRRHAGLLQPALDFATRRHAARADGSCSDGQAGYRHRRGRLPRRYRRWRDRPAVRAARRKIVGRGMRNTAGDVARGKVSDGRPGASPRRGAVRRRGNHSALSGCGRRSVSGSASAEPTDSDSWFDE